MKKSIQSLNHAFGKSLNQQRRIRPVVRLSSNAIMYLRGSMTVVALPGIELTHQVNVVKSAIVELSVWHKRWMLQLVSFICGIQVGL